MEASESRHIKIGVVDLDGVIRGKYVSRAKFLSGLDSGLGFCDVILGWDVEDKCYDNVTMTGWHTGFPDAQVRIVPSTCREIPMEDQTLFFLCEFTGPSAAICPRGLLQRVLERAQGMGFSAYAAFEYEFFVFEETPHSIREKGYRNLKPWTPGSFGYSVLRNSAEADFYHELLATCDKMDMPLEGLHTETGPGVLEACITVDNALEAADRAALFKTFTKVLRSEAEGCSPRSWRSGRKIRPAKAAISTSRSKTDLAILRSTTRSNPEQLAIPCGTSSAANRRLCRN